MGVGIAIAIAGAGGALARWGLDGWIERRGGIFPWGIFVVNVTGALLIGFLVTVLTGRLEDISWLRAGVLVGFLGAYTTFSTLSLDSYRLLEDGHISIALANSFGSMAAGIAAVWLGIKLGQLVV